MKRPCFTLILPAFAIVLWSCHNQHKTVVPPNSLPSSVVNITSSASQPSDRKLPVISFADTAFDFGTLEAGDKVSHSYTFTNKGKADLVITAAKGSCGCTIASIPKDAIHPGQSDKIDVTFDSAGKQGKVLKYVYVTTNCAPNTSYLTFTANILTTNN